VWGYLVPMDSHAGDVMVLRRREACPVPTALVGKTNGKDPVCKGEYKGQEENYENEKQERGVPAGGYLIGRHRECGKSQLCTHCVQWLLTMS
jgi:serine/threonine-protein kinase Chk2